VGLKALLAAGAVAGFAVTRVRAYAEEQGKTVGEVLADLPDRLAQDMETIPDDIRMAVHEGRLAAGRAAAEFEEHLKRL
jgi:hypothetical protein